MNAELTSLLANKADGEAQVSARKAIVAKLKGDEAEAHKAALAREEANLFSIESRISELSETSKPKY